jgi:hypothetical protein
LLASSRCNLISWEANSDSKKSSISALQAAIYDGQDSIDNRQAIITPKSDVILRAQTDGYCRLEAEVHDCPFRLSKTLHFKLS